jgi:hypothetical protein
MRYFAGQLNRGISKRNGVGVSRGPSRADHLGLPNQPPSPSSRFFENLRPTTEGHRVGTSQRDTSQRDTPIRQKRRGFASWIVDAVLCIATQPGDFHGKWSWFVPRTISRQMEFVCPADLSPADLSRGPSRSTQSAAEP